MLTLTHTHEGGTVLEGTSRGDASRDVLRARPGGAYWKWSSNLGAWFIVRSRDTRPDWRRIDAAVEALRAAGFDVDVQVDTAVRPTAEVVAGQRERAGDRAEALHAKADRHAGAARAAWDAEHEILDAIPPGQPILVGHHSERRHRRALDRAHTLMGQAIEHNDTAKDAARRAEISERAASGKEARSTVANRVKKAAADVARDLRTLHGHFRRWGESQNVEWDTAAGRYVLVFRAVDPDSRYGQELAARIAENTDRRLYWSEVLAEMPAPAKPAKAAKGDEITAEWGDTYKAVRSSKWDVTVSNPSEDDPKRTLRIPWCRVSKWVRAADVAPAQTAVDLDAVAEPAG